MLRFIIICLLVFIGACSSSLEDYTNSQPEFDLKGYFTGPVTAYGIVQDYTGKLTRHFCVDIIGSWQGNQGQLDETFYFDDGEQQKRLWQLSLQEDGEVSGQAEDVVGQASGRAQGKAFRWQYQLTVPIDGSAYTFSLDDWLYRLDNKRLFNRTSMKKFGLQVGEITLFFDKTLASCQTG